MGKGFGSLVRMARILAEYWCCGAVVCVMCVCVPTAEFCAREALRREEKRARGAKEGGMKRSSSAGAEPAAHNKSPGGSGEREGEKEEGNSMV